MAPPSLPPAPAPKASPDAAAATATAEAPIAAEAAYIETTVNYAARPPPGDVLYTRLYETGAGAPASNVNVTPTPVRVYDARPLLAPGAPGAAGSLRARGFQLERLASTVKDWGSDEEVKAVYYPEVEAAVKRAAGAARVRVFDHTRRRTPVTKDGRRVLDDYYSRNDVDTPDARRPVLRAHVDYTVKSGPQRNRDFMGPEAEELAKRPFAIIQVWKGLDDPVLEAPLAFCDASTVAPDDLLATELRYPDRTGEVYHVAANPRHRWYYVPRLAYDEALIFTCYHSAEDGSWARFTPHTAVVDPHTPPGAPPRSSIEVRALVYW